VQEAGRALGVQVIMISHHDLSVFEQFADKVYRFVPLLGGVVEVSEVSKSASNEDPLV
jgi:ABC-type dipeptide/oligopeptide/nickel transport system ATPase component